MQEDSPMHLDAMAAMQPPQPVSPQLPPSESNAAPGAEVASSLAPAPPHGEFPCVTSFDDLELREGLLRGIYSYGFEKPSDVQQRVLPVVLSGRDAIVRAKSGTGKTAAYVIGALQRIDMGLPSCQLLSLVPTRELAWNIYGVVVALGKYIEGRCVVCVGGNSVRDTIEKLRDEKPQTVLGTAGRVLDFVNRQRLHLEDLVTLVIDEVDEILARGFEEQVVELFPMTRPHCQVCIFSSTMPEEVQELSLRITNDAVRVELIEPDLHLKDTPQFYINVEKEDWKLDSFRDLLEEIPKQQAIVFCNTRRKVEYLREQLEADGLADVAMLHGDMTAIDRHEAMQGFLEGRKRLLLTTDLLARGLNLQAPGKIMAINYDLPHSRENYLLRVGTRPRRFPHKVIKVAVSFVTAMDFRALKDFEKEFGIEIQELAVNMDALRLS